MKPKTYFQEFFPVLLIVIGCFSLAIIVPKLILSNQINDNYQSESLLDGNELTVDDIIMVISSNTVSVQSMSEIEKNSLFPIISSLMCTNTNKWFYTVKDISETKMSNPMQENGLVTSIINASVIVGTEEHPIVLQTKNRYGGWPFVELSDELIQTILSNKTFILNYKGEQYKYNFTKELETMYSYSDVCKQ